ncbi:BLOC-3 complex member HPS4-like [Ptychodera flava]|uniref:BLOC-3 complex member HPS4-like n=1 Tax=Ptychodera flava TaxID=63121 RepID=UPI003969BCB5
MADDEDSTDHQLFFVFDTSAMQREEDDLKDAIVYLHPPGLLTNPALYEQQCNICGQLIGMIRCVQDITKSPPKSFKLKRMKFAVEYDGVYTVALAGKLSEPDTVLANRMKRLISIFTFYHGSIEKVLQAEGNDRKSFLAQMARIWECYIPYVHHYGNLMAAVFNPLARVKFPKGHPSLFLKTSHMLQYCQSHHGVMAGCLIYKDSVLYSQLSTDLLCKLLLLRPNQSNHPSNAVNTDFHVPVGVRILSVYLTNQEYRKLNQRRVPKHRKPVYAMMTPTIRRSPEVSLLDSARRYQGDSPNVSFHLSGSSPDISAMSDFESDLSSKYVRWSSESSESLPRKDPDLVKVAVESAPKRDEPTTKEVVSEIVNQDSRKPDRRVQQNDFSVEKLTHLIKTISGNCLEDLAKQDMSTKKSDVEQEPVDEIKEEQERSDGTDENKVMKKSELHSSRKSPNGLKLPYREYEIIEENEGLPFAKYESLNSLDDVFDDSKNEISEHVNSQSKELTLTQVTPVANGGGDRFTVNKIESLSANANLHTVNADGDAGSVSLSNEYHSPRTQDIEQENLSANRTGDGETVLPDRNPTKFERVFKQDETSSLSEPEVTEGHNTGDFSPGNVERQQTVESDPGSNHPLVSEIGEDSDSFRHSGFDSFHDSLQTIDDIDEENDNILKDVSLYVQGHSNIVLLLLLEKKSSKDERIIHSLWKSVLQQLGEVEISIQHALGKDTSLNPSTNYNYLVYDDDEKSLTGNLLQPVVPTEHALCDVARLMHHEFEQSELLTDMTVRSFSTVVYGRHTLSRETYFQPKGVIGPNLGAPSCKDGAILLESSANSRLASDNDVILL